MNNNLYFSLLAAVTAAMTTSCSNDTSAHQSLSSPDGQIQLTFDLTTNGRPYYSMVFQGDTIIRPSMLGFELKDQKPLTDGFKIQSVTTDAVDETWVPVWGENDSIENRYNTMTIALKQDDRRLEIEFRVFDNGMGLRYIFPEQAQKTFEITGEFTEMAMGGDYTAWWIPGDYDTQEYEYTKSKLSEIRSLSTKDQMGNISQSVFSPTGVQTSLMLKTPGGKYVNLHEAALVNYPAMHLNLNDTTLTFTSQLTPGRGDIVATVETPFTTPWRTITVGNKATDILASNLIYNLNEPCALDDTSWIEPVKYMGVWWEMITGKSSWSYTDATDFDLATFDYSSAKPHGNHAANNENVKRYIDFAADNGFDQLLIEGWNVGWEDWFGKEKEYVFDFVTPYPDFDIEELNRYAHSKGIKLMMHHETSGSIENYERHMDAAYDLMNKYGYNAVKSGYVGNILPKGEHHYSQWAVNHYLNAIKKAADHNIMVNAHEAVRPTGLARTYPNLVGNESAMGTEYQTMTPAHVTILPFTRLQGGPMDFTPGIFEMNLSKVSPKNTEHKRATVANQLALYVTMYSPLQMAADLPENYARKMDAFKFIKDVPVDWSESRYLDAEPGEFIIAARREKGKQNWFVGGVTNEQARDYNLNLDFLTPGKTYTATIYADAPDAHYDTNPAAYRITTRQVTSADTLHMHMAPGGGFAVSIIAE